MNSENKLLSLPPRVAEIIKYYFDNPQLNHTELAKHFGVTLSRISHIMHNPRVINSFPLLAKRRVKQMVPKAISRLDQLMSQNDNLAVAEKAVSKVLDSEHVLEPAPQRVVHELEMKSVEELLQIVADTKGLPSVSLQAEIVDAEVVEDK